MPDKYYTPCNVGIYIGGYRLSDAFRVDWDARDSKTPLYGWADDTFSAVSNGRKIITGRLVINYRHPGYLATAIAEFTKQGQIDLKEHRQAVNDAEEFFSKDSTQKVKFLAQIAAKDYGEDVLGGDAMFDQRRSADFAKWVSLLQSNPKLQARYAGHLDHAKEAYKQKRTFDILVAYGNITSEDHIETTIKDAYIVGQSQVISASATGGGDVSSSGSPIYEIYSFFAKEIVERNAPARKMASEHQKK
jgi:hypothetical protein